MHSHTPCKWRCLFDSPAVFPMLVGFCVTCLWVWSLSTTDVIAFRAFRVQWQIASQNSTAYVERISKTAPGIAMLGFRIVASRTARPQESIPSPDPRKANKLRKIARRRDE
jgi:hypothetical protein